MSLRVPMDDGGNDHMQMVEAQLGPIIPTPTKVRRDIRYVFLCFTNRSGSNFLANALSSSGYLNRAGEFFNGNAIVDNCLKYDLASVADYFNWLSHTLEQNGFLVSKLTYDSLEILAKARIFDQIADFSRFVAIERIDKLAQAISCDRAFQTGQWTHDMPSQISEDALEYSSARIGQFIDYLLDQNRRFGRFFAFNGITPAVVLYERFAQDPARQVNVLGQYLGIPELCYAPENIDCHRQADRINREWWDRYVSESRELANSSWEKPLMRAEVRLVSQTDVLPYSKMIYRNLSGIEPATHDQRFQHWWAWSNQNGLNSEEYVLPQLHLATSIGPFGFEHRFTQERHAAPSLAEIEALAPWAYQVEFGSTSTLGVRNDADWKYHRYRGSLFGGIAGRIAGPRIPELSVLDVGCHCGVQALEIAELGFGRVVGVDLRAANIRQARFLMSTFGSRHVSFEEKNVWDLEGFPSHDIITCAGLLYHVTYPLRLLKILHDLTNEFLILDSAVHKHPFSGFYLVCNKDITYSAEGEFSYELHPTYRAICEGLQAVGFTTIYELIGDRAGEVPNYASGTVRTFVAAKHGARLLPGFISSISLDPSF
jgi:LPS sulfotransferase NodH